MLLFTAIVMLCGEAPFVQAAAPASDNSQSSGQNPRSTASGRLLIVHNTRLGEITIVFGPNGEASVPKGALIDMLLPLLDSDHDLLSRMSSLRDWDGNVALAEVEKIGFVVELDRSHLRLARATIVTSAPPRPGATQPARGSRLELVVMSGTRKLGEITAEVSRSSTVRIPKAAFIDMLSPVFDASAIQKIENLRDVRGQIDVAELASAGFVINIEGNRLDVAGGQAAASSAKHDRTDSGSRPSSKPDETVIGSAGRLALVVHNGDVLGEIHIRADSDNRLLLTKSALVDILTPALEKESSALTRLAGVPDREDQVALEALQRAGLEIRFSGGRIEVGGGGAGQQKETAVYSKPVSSRLNPTGGTITLNVPLVEGDTRLGEILVRIQPNGTIIVPKAALVQQLAPVLEDGALAQLQKIPDRNGLITLGDLSGASFRLAYDPNQMELTFRPAIEQRPRKDLNYARNGLTTSSSVAQPAILSGFVNITGGGDYSWVSPHVASLFLDMQSAIRVSGVVVENDFTYVGQLDPVQCPIGARCLYDHQEGLKRRYSRLVYDLPEQKVRVQLGDVGQQPTSFQHSTDVLGLAVEKSARKLAPGEVMSPTLGSSFSVERPSDVDVVINGAIAQRLKLRPGNYNISDLPLAGGANEIELIITDDRGQRRTLTLSTFADAKMVAAGKSEWAFSAGMASYLVDGERAYLPGEYMANGIYRLGLTNKLSMEVQAKADLHAVEGGAGLLAATSWGVFAVNGAVGTSEIGNGVGANASWDLVNARGLLGMWGIRESLRLAAEYRSTLFRSPGDSLISSNGILYPETPYWLRLISIYSVPLSLNTTASVSARYQFADPHQPTYTPFRIDGDRYGSDLTLSTRLGPAVSTSLTAGYSNEITQRAFDNSRGDVTPEMRVMLRLFVQPMENTRISASYDTLNHSSSVSAYHGASSGVQRWEADVNAQTDDKAQQKVINGSLMYAGNRGELRIGQNASVDDLGGMVTDRSSMRFGTAIAFADGRVGLGPPVRGNGFAVVYPHESLSDKPITVGDAAAPRAYANILGPALVPDLPAYVQNSITVDVKDLPPGYSLGSGAFDVIAPYRAGYALQVGSANSVSAFGTLLRSDLEPLGLTTGFARPVENRGSGKTVTVFTNQSGRFVAEGLAPGIWAIEMATEGTPTLYRIEVPKDTQGLLQAGVLTPVDRP